MLSQDLTPDSAAQGSFLTLLKGPYGCQGLKQDGQVS